MQPSEQQQQPYANACVAAVQQQHAGSGVLVLGTGPTGVVEG